MNRIIIYGAPTAGKLSLLRALKQRHNAEDALGSYIKIPYTVQTGQQIDHCLQVLAVRTKIGGMAFCTFSGEVVGLNAWRPVIQDTEGVILVLNSDPQPPLQNGNRAIVGLFEEIMSGSHKPGCIVCSKADLENGSMAVERALEQARQIPVCRQWSVFQTRADHPQSMSAPIDHMIGLFGA